VLGSSLPNTAHLSTPPAAACQLFVLAEMLTSEGVSLSVLKC
jgi:hypothetical protein